MELKPYAVVDTREHPNLISTLRELARIEHVDIRVRVPEDDEIFNGSSRLTEVVFSSSDPKSRLTEEVSNRIKAALNQNEDDFVTIGWKS